jgi:hypothetical protein
VAKNSSVSPEYLNIRIVSRKQLKTIDGDDLHLAINIKNSRVGMSRFVVQFMLYKWICSNGVIFGGGVIPMMKRRHTGDIAADCRLYLENFIKDIPSITTKIEEFVSKSKSTEVNQESFEKIMLQFQAKKLPKVTERILETIPNYGGMNMMNVINAMTEVAQNYSNDTREAIEEFSGSLMAAI